jgi:hypothetical protein
MILSAEEFVRLRTSDLREEYSRAAEDEAPVAIWMDLISRFPDMREWVAHNRTVPLEILEVLARDPQRRVRAAVADRRKLSAELFDLLSRDDDEVVRHRIAYNGKTPVAIIERLAADPVPLVRDAARKRHS